MAQLVKCLPCKHEDLNLAPPGTYVKGWVSVILAPGVVTQAGAHWPGSLAKLMISRFS